MLRVPVGLLSAEGHCVGDRDCCSDLLHVLVRTDVCEDPSLVLGTSLKVTPAAYLIKCALASEMKVIIDPCEPLKTILDQRGERFINLHF